MFSKTFRRRPTEANFGKVGGRIVEVEVSSTPGYGSAVLVALNEAFTFVPSAVIVVMQATTIKASMTAVSLVVKCRVVKTDAQHRADSRRGIDQD